MLEYNIYGGEEIMLWFKKKEKDSLVSDVDKLCSIPCDYDGYEFFGKADETNPSLYEHITNIITNNRFDVKNIPTYNGLTKDSNQEDFDVFFDEWIEYLKKQNHICYLDNSVTIQEFANNINNSLKEKNYVGIDVQKAETMYYEELEKMEIYSKIKFDILTANVIASMLRENKLELIALFDGFDSNNFTIIKGESVAELKALEEKITIRK